MVGEWYLPSRKLTYPTFGKGRYLQKCLGRGYASSQEGKFFFFCALFLAGQGCGWIDLSFRWGFNNDIWNTVDVRIYCTCADVVSYAACRRHQSKKVISGAYEPAQHGWWVLDWLTSMAKEYLWTKHLCTHTRTHMHTDTDTSGMHLADASCLILIPTSQI